MRCKSLSGFRDFSKTRWLAHVSVHQRPSTVSVRVGRSSRVRLCAGGFRGLASNQIGQVRDLVETPYAIPKITPEGHAELPTGRLQAEKSIPAAPARVAPRSR